VVIRRDRRGSILKLRQDLEQQQIARNLAAAELNDRNGKPVGAIAHLLWSHARDQCTGRAAARRCAPNHKSFDKSRIREFANRMHQSHIAKSTTIANSQYRKFFNATYPLRICRIGSGNSFVPSFQHVLHALQS